MKVINWIYVLDDADLPEGHMVPCYPMGVNVALARAGGIVYAFSGMCLHMACPLFTGKLEGYIITCPCHDWRYDIRTGKFIDTSELGIGIYSTKSVDGRLFIDLN
jgi:3-phenylpropionate/trans-cinnamate dioxygenase ferredoxin subunit